MANEGEQQPGWTYKPGDSSNEQNSGKTTENQPADVVEPNNQDEGTPKSSEESVSWTASEFVSHQKNAGWYLGLIIATVALSAVAFLLTKDYITSVTIVIVSVLFAIVASKKPRQLSYKIDPLGITIGQKTYPFESFKSFALVNEGAIGCINLLPLKRFMPDISIYYPPDQEQKIIDVLSASLPHDQREEHQFDRLMKKIRF